MKKFQRIRKAYSLNNGIIFDSNQLPYVEMYTFYDENGVIRKQQVINLTGEKREFITDLDKKEYEKKLDKQFHFVTLIYMAIMLIGISLSCYTSNFGIYFVALYLVIRNTVPTVVAVVSQILEYKPKDGKRHPASLFHAAEHMAINAYNKLGRIPTYEEVEKESRFSKYCGSLFFFNKIFLDFVVCIIIFVLATSIKYSFIFLKYQNEISQIDYARQSLMLVLIYATIILLIFLVYKPFKDFITKHGLLRHLEVFFTAKPTEKEITLAIKGLENYEQMENELIAKMDELNRIYIIMKALKGGA